MTRVLVTGASGFLGGAIWRRLSERADIDATSAGRAELGDRTSIVKALSDSRPDVVVHAAGRTHGSIEAFAADNVTLTRNLAETLASVAPQTRLILLSSAAQYGPSPDRIPWLEDAGCGPLDAYGISKLEAECAAFEGASHVTSLRVFNVVAPVPSGPQVFSNFLRKAAAADAGRSAWAVELGPLDAVRDFIALDDVVEAVEHAIERDVTGVINVCTGYGRAVGDLVRDVASKLSPGVVHQTAAAAGGVPWSVGDPARCEALLGFKPSADLSDVTRRAAEWVRAQARAGAHA